MSAEEALEIILPYLKDDDIALFTTGMISRHAFSLKDRESNFYMIGSMGLVSSVGLGMALNTEKKVFIFDGDGSILMDLGAMAMIANHHPVNLFHFVLDNQCYESTGRQPTISEKINLAEVATAVGYQRVFKFKQAQMFKEAIKAIFGEQGPVFILLKLDLAKSMEEPERVSIAPEELTLRIKGVL